MFDVNCNNIFALLSLQPLYHMKEWVEDMACVPTKETPTGGIWSATSVRCSTAERKELNQTTNQRIVTQTLLLLVSDTKSFLDTVWLHYVLLQLITTG